MQANTPKNRRKLVATAIAASALAASAPSGRAITINVSFDPVSSEAPALDPNGDRLKLIMQAAANYWEGLIEDAGVLDISYYYQSNIAGNALFSNGVEAGGRIVSGLIRFEPTPAYTNPVYVPSNGWYYDPSPLNNSEYQMQQVLYRDMSPANQAAMFSGSPPDLLESAFQGPVSPGAPAAAQDAADLWTYAIHELGHALGMAGSLSTTTAELADNDYDINSNFVNGATCATRISTSGGAHVTCTQCLMNTSIGRDNRRLPSAADVFSIATCPSPSWSSIHLRRQDFLPGGTTNWGTAGNWEGNRVPDSGIEASLRIDELTTVRLSAAAACRSLFISGRSRLDLNAYKLSVAQTLTADSDDDLFGGDISVDPGGEVEAARLVIKGADLNLLGGLVDVATDLVIDATAGGSAGRLVGFGNIEIDGKLTNNGTVAGDGGQFNALTFHSPNPLAWDLDGTNGGGRVRTFGGNLNFASGGLSDDFDGTMIIDQSDTLSIAAPWTLGSGGLVQLLGGQTHYAKLSGGKLVAEKGDIDFLGLGRITSPLQLGGSLRIDFAQPADVEFDGATTISGGTYALAEDTSLRFDSSCAISGGTFMVGNGAVVNLNGAHTLSGGNFIGLGELSFNGATTIAAPVTVSSLITDLDGNGAPNKQVTLDSDLTINSAALDESDNTFNSTLNINGSANQLEVNGPSSWTMAGVLNIASGTPFTFPSIAGAPFVMGGTAIIDGGTRWDARTTIAGTVSLAAAGDRLALGSGGANRIEGGTLLGLGTLRAFGTHLSGHGQIATPIDFVAGASLLADDGVLEVTGPFTNVPPLIGTADSDGSLAVANSWTLPSSSVLELDGGTVTGGTITNRGVTRGHGGLNPNKFINNGALAATGGQTLVIDSTYASDLDGVGTVAEVKLHTMAATDGDIELASSVLDAFDGVATVGPGRHLCFLGGWQLGTNGELDMAGGGADSPASIEGTSSYLNGVLLLDGHVRLATANTFAPSSTTTLADAGTVMHLAGDTLITQGATLSGAGSVEVGAGRQLTLDDGAAVEAAVANLGGKIVLGASIGRATVASYSQAPQSRLKFDIQGAPAGTDWDQLKVSGPAQLGGELEVDFSFSGAQAGDMWKVLDAGSVTGSFSSFKVAGVPGGLVLQKFEAADGVYVKLSSNKGFSKWAVESGLPEGQQDGPGDDPDGDSISNALEMFLGGDPLVADVGILPDLVIVEVGGVNYLGMRIEFAWHNVPEDLQLSVARSADLAAWSAVEVVTHSSELDPLTCLEIRTYRSVYPFEAPGREFLRIQVDGP